MPVKNYLMGAGAAALLMLPVVKAEAQSREQGLDEMYLPGPRFATYTYWGSAT
jgi:hypothetical protein